MVTITGNDGAFGLEMVHHVTKESASVPETDQRCTPWPRSMPSGDPIPDTVTTCTSVGPDGGDGGGLLSFHLHACSIVSGWQFGRLLSKDGVIRLG